MANRMFSIALLFVSAVAFSACFESPVLRDTIDHAFDIPADPIPPVEPAPGCFVDRHQQPNIPVTRKIDILFITDTSGSFNDERGEVADGIDSFVMALPAQVDYRVAVLLAHSSRSPHDGRLYKYHNEPRVLSSDSMTLAEIRTALHDKMTHVATDNYSDGGEMGMYSLNRLLDTGKIDAARAAGFFRTDAALAVVFVADENDICAIYPAGVTPVPDPQGIEVTARARDCTRHVPATILDGGIVMPPHDETITPELTVQKLSSLQDGRPLVVSGIIYNNIATVPPGGENEIGYGYRETIQLANGLIVDMADGDYGTGLGNIGSLAHAEMDLVHDFALSQSRVDVATLEVRVDGVSTIFTYSAELNQVHVADPGRPLSTIDISYCQLPDPNPGVNRLCTAGAFQPKSGISVGLSLDPNEGSQTTIVNGLTALGLTPTVYSESQVIAGQPTADNKTVLIVARKVVLAATSQAYVDAVKSFIDHGGSVLGEYDGAALFFHDFALVNTSYQGHFTPAIDLFTGAVAGGGLVLPVSASVVTVTNPSSPLMTGVPTTLNSGLRAAFALSGFDTSWLETSATFTATGSGGLVPAGTYPAVLSGRCGPSRLAFFTMNHLQALSNAGVGTMVQNTMHWLVGN